MVFVNPFASAGKIMKFNKEKNCFACLANNNSNNSHTEPKARKEREQAIQRGKQGIMKKAPGKPTKQQCSEIFCRSSCPSIRGESR